MHVLGERASQSEGSEAGERLLGLKNCRMAVCLDHRDERLRSRKTGDWSLRALKATVTPGLCSKPEGQLSSSGMKRHDSAF